MALLASSFVPCLAARQSQPRPFVSNGTEGRLSMKVHDSFHVQVEVGETEPVDMVLKKFKRSVNSTGLVRTARRQMHFENSQLEKKRRAREMHSARKSNFPPAQLWDEVHQETPLPNPFGDMFPSAKAAPPAQAPYGGPRFQQQGFRQYPPKPQGAPQQPQQQQQQQQRAAR